jgi:hypothetical protein
MKWKKYQEQVADVFRSAGCSADIEAIVEGVRGKHKIDVLVNFEKYGVTCLWVVECKHWNSNVPKEKVLALQSIVDDIGADRGLLISKVGFQSGAIRLAQKSNITLTSLEDLKEDLRQDSTKRIIDTLESNLLRLMNKIFALSKTEKLGNRQFRIYYPEGINGREAAEHGGRLSIIETGFMNYKLGKDRYPLQVSEDGNKIQTTESIERFIEAVRAQISKTEKWLSSLPQQKD